MMVKGGSEFLERGFIGKMSANTDCFLVKEMAILNISKWANGF